MHRPDEFWTLVTERYVEVFEREPTPGERNQASFRALNEGHRFGAMSVLLAGIARPEPQPPTPEIPLPDEPAHSDFLAQRLLGRQPFMTLNLPAFSPEDQVAAFAEIVANGYTGVDLYAMNVGPPGDDPFRTGKWRINAAENPSQVLECIQRAHAAGLSVTLWGWSDDMRGIDIPRAVELQEQFLPILGPHIQRYVCALEGNEGRGTSGSSVNNPKVWSAENVCKYLAPSARTHFAGKIFVHWTKGNNPGSSWPAVDGLYYQTVANDPSGVESEVRSKIGKWHNDGKIFIASEWRGAHDISAARARELGDAAVRGGADGTANGRSAR